MNVLFSKILSNYHVQASQDEEVYFSITFQIGMLSMLNTDLLVDTLVNCKELLQTSVTKKMLTC